MNAYVVVRAARVGFVWPTVEDVVAKLDEEVAELKVEIAAGDVEKARQEMGDVLFGVADLAPTLHVDPGQARRSAHPNLSRRLPPM